VDELLGAVLWAIAEFLLEAFLELGATAVLDVVSRAVEGVFTKVAEATTANRALATIAYALLGVLAGALSLLVLPHPLVHPAHPSRFHGIKRRDGAVSYLQKSNLDDLDILLQAIDYALLLPRNDEFTEDAFLPNRPRYS
jgi:thiol:disulfide interchange protein